MSDTQTAAAAEPTQVTGHDRLPAIERRAALLLLIWQLGEWTLYPPEGDFPYALYSPLLALAIVGTWDAWRRTRRLRGAGVPKAWHRWLRNGALSAAALAAVGSVSMWIWAERQVATLADSDAADPGCSRVFLDATVAMEDGGFYAHHGIEPAAIHRALRRDLRELHKREGGSTITQQLAKNLFLTQERTLGRKVREAFLAIALERRFTKQQILDLYVTHIDYGMGQRGIHAAARYYFGETPEQLDLAQSAVLVGSVPGQPHVGLDVGKLDDGRQKALRRIATQYPDRYPASTVQAARQIGIERLVAPLRSQKPEVRSQKSEAGSQ